MKDFREFIDFVRNVYNTPTDFIPLHEPRFRGNEKKILLIVLTLHLFPV